MKQNKKKKKKKKKKKQKQKQKNTLLSRSVFASPKWGFLVILHSSR